MVKTVSGLREGRPQPSLCGSARSVVIARCFSCRGRMGRGGSCVIARHSRKHFHIVARLLVSTQWKAARYGHSTYSLRWMCSTCILESSASCSASVCVREITARRLERSSAIGSICCIPDAEPRPGVVAPLRMPGVFAPVTMACDVSEWLCLCAYM